VRSQYRTQFLARFARRSDAAVPNRRDVAAIHRSPPFPSQTEVKLGMSGRQATSTKIVPNQHEHN
jgi:hypothetical protein